MLTPKDLETAFQFHSSKCAFCTKQPKGKYLMTYRYEGLPAAIFSMCFMCVFWWKFKSILRIVDVKSVQRLNEKEEFYLKII